MKITKKEEIAETAVVMKITWTCDECKREFSREDRAEYHYVHNHTYINNAQIGEDELIKFDSYEKFKDYGVCNLSKWKGTGWYLIKYNEDDGGFSQTVISIGEYMGELQEKIAKLIKLNNE